MRENKYDDQTFFEKYSQMARSQKGLAGAGEWYELEKLLQNGFQLTGVVEPAPPEDMLDIPGMKDELRRPMMLLVSAEKQMTS